VSTFVLFPRIPDGLQVRTRARRTSVSGTPSCSLSSMAVMPNSSMSRSMSSATASIFLARLCSDRLAFL